MGYRLNQIDEPFLWQYQNLCWLKLAFIIKDDLRKYKEIWVVEILQLSILLIRIRYRLIIQLVSFWFTKKVLTIPFLTN